MKEYGYIPTFSEFSDFIEQKGYELDARALYKEFSDRGWTTSKGTPALSWVALINARNGAMLARRTRNQLRGIPDKDKLKMSRSERRELAVSNWRNTHETTEEVKMSYRKELTHPFWYAFRNFVLAVKGCKCELCGTTQDTMNIHHIEYTSGRHAWEYSTKDVKVLCRKCHKRVHGLV